MNANIEALKKEAALQRLSDFTQEADNKPVAWMLTDRVVSSVPMEGAIPLYTHPVKELTDEEIDKIENAIYCKTIQKGKTQNEYIKAFAKELLRKAQEK